MSTADRRADVDERLARLAPTTSPDPERLDAARAALDRALDGTDDGTGPTRSRWVGGAHVLDLDAARPGLDDGAPHPALDDAVVVPLRRGRTARERRRQRVQLGAAAAGVVGVVAVGLVLAPSPAAGPASTTEASCAASLTASAVPEEFDLDPAWSLLAQEHIDGTDLTLLRSPATGMTGFCSDATDAGGSTSTSTLWTDAAPAPLHGEVSLGGTVHDEWYVAWGPVGPGARAVRLQVEPDDDDRSDSSTRIVDAVLDGDGWSVFLPGDEVPPDARVSLVWTAYGTERSLALDSAWLEDGESATALTEQRRRACTDDSDVPGLRPLIEKRYDDLGLTAMMNDRREVVVCIQDAQPPYDSWNTTSGPADSAPARDVAAAYVGGSTDRARMLTGFAGDDVASVELETEDGTVIPAELADGYWVAWSTTVGEAAWDEARLVWYLEDGSRHEGPESS
ncbi:hypothetical protein [Krasilnikoviella flava]|uniref:Uncharacterized protein n=1 Tax=Krasilnikoviella flava TaxID=526729 RepID=A0A1T5ISX5_9MICO|nr:hypothetical protein [Krasilnikoviella flava]SKC42033.1 hypothetical protein SAMN04324258_0872 [Krasilnikoviella flava]